MVNTNRIIDEVADAVEAAISGGVAGDVKNNLCGVLHAVFDRLDLVTREELEVQAAVLRRTREKVQRLEKQVAELEAKLLEK